MSKFLITEEEKQRILEMHKSAIKRQYLFEGNTEPGTIIAQQRSQDLVDQGMNYIGFQINGDPSRTIYYYNCTAEFDSTPEEQVGPQKAGAIHDGNGIVKTVADLGMTGNYQEEFRNACSNIYTWIANKRKTFCADPKNKTKRNFAWNCPEPKAAPTQVASAQTNDDAEAQKAAHDKEVMDQTAAKLAVEREELRKNLAIMGNYPVDLNKAYYALANAIDKEGGTQAEVEEQIDAINSVINNPNQHAKDYLYKSQFENIPKEGGNFWKKGGYKSYITRYMATAKEKFPNLSKTVDVDNIEKYSRPPQQEAQGATNENYYRDYYKRFIF